MAFMEQKTCKHPRLLSRIQSYMERHQVKKTRFGKEAVGDHNLVDQLMAGREFRQDTIQRIDRFLRVKPKQTFPKGKRALRTNNT